MNQETIQTSTEAGTQTTHKRRKRLGVWITLIGAGIFVLGAKPGWLLLDRSPLVGFVQISVFLIGLAVICLGGYIGIASLWQSGQRSILADIGLRLVATGLVIAVFSGMADVFGMGSHSLPRTPFFGAWQVRGVEVGQIFIAVGFLMSIPFKKSAPEDQG